MLEIVAGSTFVLILVQHIDVWLVAVASNHIILLRISVRGISASFSHILPVHVASPNNLVLHSYMANM